MRTTALKSEIEQLSFSPTVETNRLDASLSINTSEHLKTPGKQSVQTCAGYRSMVTPKALDTKPTVQDGLRTSVTPTNESERKNTRKRCDEQADHDFKRLKSNENFINDLELRKMTIEREKQDLEETNKSLQLKLKQMEATLARKEIKEKNLNSKIKNLTTELQQKEHKICRLTCENIGQREALEDEMQEDFERKTKKTQNQLKKLQSRNRYLTQEIEKLKQERDGHVKNIQENQKNEVLIQRNVLKEYPWASKSELKKITQVKEHEQEEEQQEGEQSISSFQVNGYPQWVLTEKARKEDVAFNGTEVGAATYFCNHLLKLVPGLTKKELVRNLAEVFSEVRFGVGHCYMLKMKSDLGGEALRGVKKVAEFLKSSRQETESESQQTPSTEPSNHEDDKKQLKEMIISLLSSQAETANLLKELISK